MPALTASLPSPVLRAFPLPANVSMYPTSSSAAVPMAILIPAPGMSPDFTPTRERLRSRLCASARLAGPDRLRRLGHLRLLRRLGRSGLRRERGRLRLSLRLRLCLDRIGLVDGLFESLDRLPQPFTQLRELSRAEDDQHDEQDENQLGKPDAPKHNGSSSLLTGRTSALPGV